MNNFEKTINIIAFNINTGGAKVLLNVLINKMSDINMPTSIYVQNHYVVDNKDQTNSFIQLKIIKNYIVGFLLLFQKKSNSLFFGNWPPFRKCERSILYIHSEYLVISTKELMKQKTSFSNKLKLLIQIISVNLFHHNVTHIAVQSNHMAEKLNRKLDREILILPFFEEGSLAGSYVQKTFDFCYVGLPSKHKNHESLLGAIHKLVQMNIRFSIALTVPNFKENNFLISEIETINKILPGCIENFGMADKQTVHEIYSKSRALVFPSKKESLGLPIIEALQHNLKILSSDLEFSHEIIINPITFDPMDQVQIENIMKDFLGGKFNSINQSLKIKSHIDTIIKICSG